LAAIFPRIRRITAENSSASARRGERVLLRTWLRPRPGVKGEGTVTEYRRPGRVRRVRVGSEKGLRSYVRCTAGLRLVANPSTAASMHSTTKAVRNAM
jgi:hypothetical protein